MSTTTARVCDRGGVPDGGRTPLPDDRRSALVAAATDVVRAEGTRALRARPLAARCDTSTQAIYTLFGGMPAVLDAVVARGFAELAGAVEAVPEGADPVADFFLRGIAYSGWALANPHLYRAMFATDGAGGSRIGFTITAGGSAAPSREGADALRVLERSIGRAVTAGRTRPVEADAAAARFLAATHGYLVLELAGAFGDAGHGITVASSLAVDLMVGLGDRRESAERSWADAARRAQAPPG